MPLTLHRDYADLDGLAAPVTPVPVARPRLVALNEPLAAELGLDAAELRTPEAVEMWAGNRVPDGAVPVAQVYAGHQFGAFNPQLGDGRAVLLGEVTTPDGTRVDVTLKGSGRTPFSRGGDGRAALGPVLREYLVADAMHALGIPTTRALAAVTTGETVIRDGALPGAILTRVAASHLRVGTFQYFAARGDTDRVALLIDHALERHPVDHPTDGPAALVLLDAVADRVADLVAAWMHVGFVHGVMNTDNTTISGETIDYGPCAFVDRFDTAAVFSSIDHGGRYAYGNQPTIARWNLARFAETLIPHLDDDTDEAVRLATEVIDAFSARYDAAWTAGARHKLGLDECDAGAARAHAVALVELLREHRADLTRSWRALADVDRLVAEFPPGAGDDVRRWHTGYEELVGECGVDRGTWTARIAARNPIVIPRNHLVESALQAAVADDIEPWERLLEAVRHPFDDPADDAFTDPAPTEFTAGYRTFCGT